MGRSNRVSETDVNSTGQLMASYLIKKRRKHLGELERSSRRSADNEEAINRTSRSSDQ